MQPTGNNQLDKAAIINEPTGNSLFHKAGKYDTIEVAAISGDYVNAVQQEITSLYGSNNIGVITPKAKAWKVKVFFMTAFEINDIEFRRVLPSTRIDEFIQKPILLERLNTLVQNHTSA